ncbi:MAG: hypothetical protein AAGA84_00235 [Pseudomonadota bacterium]
MFNNKWVIIGLCVVAALTVFNQVIRPLMKSDSSADAAIDAGMADGPMIDSSMADMDDPSMADMMPQTTNNAVPTELQRDTLMAIDVSALAWNASPLRDPFSPTPLMASLLASSGQAEQQLTAASTTGQLVRWPRPTAIVHSQDRSAVVFGSEIYSEGDGFHDFRIRDIQQNSVLLVHNTTEQFKRVRVTP